METEAKLLDQILWYYSLTYNWLVENGIAYIKEAKSEHQYWKAYEDKAYLNYRTEIDQLASPQVATIEQIAHVAGLVVYGLFEIHYVERTGSFKMGELGRNILVLIDKIKQTQKDNTHFDEGLFASSDKVYLDDNDYFETAKNVYRNIFGDDDKNIGGRVALADTNWEFQKQVDNTDRTLFRKARLLNFTEVDEKDNLFQLALNNQIQIISITVK